MNQTSRLFFCSRCLRQSIICTYCDHGQRYCSTQCSKKARLVSLRRSGKKYQTSHQGRIKNAARQSRFRERQKQIVTHHPSKAKALHDSLNHAVTDTQKTQQDVQGCANAAVAGDNWSCGGSFKKKPHCHFCGRVLTPYFRNDFLQTYRRR